jgi:hypothetical protein
MTVKPDKKPASKGRRLTREGWERVMRAQIREERRAAGLPQDKGGRPRYTPTAEQRRLVEQLAGMAITRDNIALVLKIDVKTLMKHYPDEMRRGFAVVEAHLTGNLLRLASGNDGTALKAITFALNCKFGWSQYLPKAPQPQADEPEQLGKKAARQEAALTGHENSDWSDLVH